MDARSDPSLAAASKFYRLLIMAYPRMHRRAYDRWMVQLFCDQFRDAQSEKRTGAHDRVLAAQPG